MKPRFAHWMLVTLFPLAGMAQPLPSLVPTEAPGRTPLVDELLALGPGQGSEQAASVVPIWSGTNGKLLAVVALPREWSAPVVDAAPGYAGPSDWHLAGTASSASGFVWKLGNGFHADALFGQHLATPVVNCTASNCAVPATAWAQPSLTGTLGLGWASADGGVDFSYGLSWLQSQPQPTPTFGQLSAAEGAIPVLTLPDAMGAHGLRLDSERSLFARSRWRLDGGPLLDFAASYGKGSLSAVGQPAAIPGIDLDQLSLSLGLGVGSLRGAVVGHVLRSDDPLFAGKRWTTLDLGVSWRTPWSGELSVGAQNLLNAPLGGVVRDGDAKPQSRTPYIQYRQDL